jgi:hypothetical protein
MAYKILVAIDSTGLSELVPKSLSKQVVPDPGQRRSRFSRGGLSSCRIQGRRARGGELISSQRLEMAAHFLSRLF